MSIASSLVEQIRKINAKHNEILEKLDTLIQLCQVKPETELSEHHIKTVEHYLSTSGNPTWKAMNYDGDIIYLRQQHKEMLMEADLWDGLNSMELGEIVDADIRIMTVPDGDFLKPVKICDGWFLYLHNHREPVESAAQGLLNLQNVLENGNFVVLDTETTSLHGYVCSIAVIDSQGETILNKLVKPPIAIDASATAVHGITDEMVENAAIFADPQVADALKEAIEGKIVVGWNVDYDRNCLVNSCHYHQMREFSEFLQNEPAYIDLMTIFAQIYGEWNDYYGNYKWQKLTTAAKYYGIDTSGAHNALADCRMTLEVMRKMAEVVA